MATREVIFKKDVMPALRGSQGKAHGSVARYVAGSGGWWLVKTYKTPMLMAKSAASFSSLRILACQMIFHGNIAKTVSAAPEYATSDGGGEGRTSVKKGLGSAVDVGMDSRSTTHPLQMYYTPGLWQSPSSRRRARQAITSGWASTGPTGAWRSGPARR